MPCGLGGKSDDFVKMAEKVLSGKIESRRVLTRRDVNMLTRTIDCLNRLARRRGVGDRPFEEEDLDDGVKEEEEETVRQKKMDERTPEEKEARRQVLRDAADELGRYEDIPTDKDEDEKTKRKRWAKEEKHIRAKLEELKIQQEEAKKRQEEEKKSRLREKYAKREKRLQEDTRKPVDLDTIEHVRNHVLSYLFHRNVFFCA